MDRYAITAALHRRDVTQTALARRLKVDVSLVSRVIAGTRSTPRVRRAIARALGKPQSAIWPDAKPTTRRAA
jgi:lambda repressor-like predicted transcriptional regulator